MRQSAYYLFVLLLCSFSFAAAHAQSGRAVKKPAKTTAVKAQNTNAGSSTVDSDFVVTQQGTKLRKVEPKALKETPASVEGESYTLRYRFEPGLVLRSEVTHLSKNSTRINSVLQDASSRTITDKSWRVLEANEQATTFEYVVDAVDLSQQFGNSEEIRYNTKEPTDQVPVQFAGAVESVGKVISTIRIDARGMVIARSDSKDPPHMGMGDITLPLPENPISVGATWEIPRELRIDRKDGTSRMIKFRELFKLDKVSAGVATISVRSEPLSPVNDPTEEAQVMQQLSNGMIQFDIDSGRMISKELAWDHQVVSFSGPGSLLEYSSRLEDRVVSSKIEPLTEGARQANSGRDSKK